MIINDNEVVFTITCKMGKRWVPYFLTMLKKMEFLGSIGSSRRVAFYSDGDGDFRPKFQTDIDYELQTDVDGKDVYDISYAKKIENPSVFMYDAG